jgi:hypothetical protein
MGFSFLFKLDDSSIFRWEYTNLYIINLSRALFVVTFVGTFFTWKADVKLTSVSYDWDQKWQFFSQYYNVNWHYSADLCQRRYLWALIIICFYHANQGVRAVVYKSGSGEGLYWGNGSWRWEMPDFNVEILVVLSLAWIHNWNFCYWFKKKLACFIHIHEFAHVVHWLISHK